MDNLYKTPDADLMGASDIDLGPRCFVTSIRKLCLLYVATLGIYTLYWGYKHWEPYRWSLGKRISPLWRTFFLIFYIHKLCALIARRLAAQGLPAWRYGSAATGYVLLTVASALLGWVSPAPTFFWLIVLPYASIGLVLLPLINIQRHANAASQDPAGSGNSTLTFSNSCFLLVGALLWVIVLLGMWELLKQGGA